MTRETLASRRAGVRALAARGGKGDVLAVARLAGIMAARRTAELIPLCHPVRLTSCDVDLTVDRALPGVRIRATARAIDRTGVEMEAMTAAATAALTIYDMVKGGRARRRDPGRPAGGETGGAKRPLAARGQAPPRPTETDCQAPGIQINNRDQGSPPCHSPNERRSPSSVPVRPATRRRSTPAAPTSIRSCSKAAAPRSSRSRSRAAS